MSATFHSRVIGGACTMYKKRSRGESYGKSLQNISSQSRFSNLLFINSACASVKTTSFSTYFLSCSSIFP